MKKVLFLLAATTLIALFCVIVIGCSSGPSNAVIKHAVQTYLSNYRDWSGGNPYSNVTDIKVVKVGQPLQYEMLGIQVKAYPVKVHLIRDYGATAGEEAQFLVYNDEYGDWHATGY